MRKLFREFFIINFLIEFSFCFFAWSFLSDAIFLLRIRNRPFIDAEMLTYDSRENLKSFAFNPKKPIIFQVHGFGEHQNIADRFRA
jgi:hypothetical protein